MTVKELIHQALELPSHNRALLAEVMLATLEDGDDFDVDPADVADAVRIAKAIDAGEMKTIPAEEVFRKIREEFGFDR